MSFHNLPTSESRRRYIGLQAYRPLCSLYIICLGTRRLRYVAPPSQLLLLLLLTEDAAKRALK